MIGQVLYGFCYMVIDRGKGREPRVFNAHYRPGEDTLAPPDNIGEVLGRIIAHRIRRASDAEG